MKFKIIGDVNNKKNCSSDIIIQNINRAARGLNLYSDNEAVVCYDCLCQDHGISQKIKTDAYICVFELPFSQFILDNANGRPILGVSRDNQSFILDGGYSPEKVSYVNLGVRSDIWKVDAQIKENNKFIVLCNGESNTRSCIIECIQAFGELFANNKDIQLYIRDRDATNIFKQ